MLSLETTAGFEEARVTLLDGDRQLATRRVTDVPRDDWDRARAALERHNYAVTLERAAEMPGVLPLPDDHVPAAEHFMAAVDALFPGLPLPDPR